MLEEAHMAAKKISGGGAPEQYLHKKSKRLNNPHIGIATAKKEAESKKTRYYFDPHTDPQLQWAGKKERDEFEVDAVPLHIHERIDTSTIIEKVLRNTNQQTILSFFSSEQNKLPLHKAIEFYKHQNNWSNRMISGDSLVVMNSLLEKEGMYEKVQMVYIDPPYGTKYASNFQPFVCAQNVKNSDENLSQEPETILAFRDTWELDIHSYLSYLRERVYLAKELLNETGSCFVQISIENLHLIRNIMDEIFGAKNFMSVITYRTKGVLRSKYLPTISDYIVWYAKDAQIVKFNPLFVERDKAPFKYIELADGSRRKISVKERNGTVKLPAGSKIFKLENLIAAGRTESCVYEIHMNGKKFWPAKNKSWKTNKSGIKVLIEKNRLMASDKIVRYVQYYDDYPKQELTNVWADTQGAMDKRYVVQTSDKIIQRCMLMTTEPGDLVFDPTCGSGTTAFIAEKYGRRWITCDTSRIAIAVAKQRIMTAVFDYYKIAHNYSKDDDVHNGFEYEQIPHITLGQIAQNEPYGAEALMDEPKKDSSKQRISGPFTVEAVPSPTVKSIDLLYDNMQVKQNNELKIKDQESNSQELWREELLKTGIRGKNKQKIEFASIETHPATRWIHAVGLTRETNTRRIAISFGPKHTPLDQRQVELALEEARALVPKITILVFAAMHIDPEAAKNIDKTMWKDTAILKVVMNKDLLTMDLKKNRSSNESFWLIGQPDIELHVENNKYVIEVKGYDYFDMEKDDIVSDDVKKIVMWMLDTDYDGRSVYPHQIFFPMSNSSGQRGLQRLSKILHSMIDEELIQQFYGTKSLPFKAGANKRAAVKIIDDRGIESIKILELE